jgi:hypothetical protein
MNENLSRFDPASGCFVLLDTRPPANAFEWKRYTEEEKLRRSEQLKEVRTCTTNVFRR